MNNPLQFSALSRRRRKWNFIALLLSFLVMATVILGFLATNDRKAPRKRYDGGTYNIGRSQNYESVLGMTPIAAHVASDGMFVIPIDEIIEAKLIYTEFSGHQGRLPIMGYVSPAGRVVMTISYCEPCRSETFRIDGRSNDKHLVCETCSTVWRLNDLRGLYGGCVYYPPEEIPYTVLSGNIVIDPNVLEEWTPRDYSDTIDM